MFILKTKHMAVAKKLSKAIKNKNKYRNALCSVFASCKDQLASGKELDQRDKVIHDYLEELGFNNALKIQESEDLPE